MTEVEGIMNSRPLTVETLSDVTSYKPLSLSDFLTVKSKFVIPSAGKFQKEDLYTRKYWRRFNIWPMSSGADGEKKYFYPCRTIKNVICKNEISWLVILSY